MANHAFAGSIPIPQTGANEITIQNFHVNPQVEFLIDKMATQYEDEYLELAETMKVCSQLRFRDLIAETVHEFCRMENFCRIFPARNSKLYDKFFSGLKHLNKIMYKVFYTSEILTYERAAIERSANPNLGKAANLVQHSAGPKMGPERIHSSSGARAIRSSKSNSKLVLQSQTSNDDRRLVAGSNVRNSSHSPTEKRDRFIADQQSMQKNSGLKQRNGSQPANTFQGLNQNAPGSTRNINQNSGIA